MRPYQAVCFAQQGAHDEDGKIQTMGHHALFTEHTVAGTCCVCSSNAGSLSLFASWVECSQAHPKLNSSKG